MDPQGGLDAGSNGHETPEPPQRRVVLAMGEDWVLGMPGEWCPGGMSLAGLRDESDRLPSCPTASGMDVQRNRRYYKMVVSLESSTR